MELAIALQHAIYVDGLSLSDAGTYRKVAGVDGDAVVAAFEAPQAQAAAEAEFRRAADLGVTGSPPFSPWPRAASPPWLAATLPPTTLIGACHMELRATSAWLTPRGESVSGSQPDPLPPYLLGGRQPATSRIPHLSLDTTQTGPTIHGC